MTQIDSQQAFDLALHHHQAGQLPQAENLYRQILAHQPQHAGALHYLGVLSHQMGRNEIAVDLIQQAVVLQPNYAEAHCNLGNILTEEGRLDEAIASYGQALAFKREYPESYCNLGYVLREVGRLDDAVAASRQALALKPEFPEAHLNLALAMLLKGDLEPGWKEYEWRWKVKDFPSPRRNFSQPQWDRSDLSNRTILFHTEQGFGDAIQFIRYVPMAVRRGGNIVVQCQPDLARLLRSNAHGWRVVTGGQPPPAFDVHYPLMSLPLAFGTTLQDIPSQTPYLRADDDGVRKWRQRLDGDSRCLKVGLAWAGRKGFKGDRNRSMSLPLLAPLAQVKNVQFFSLQKDETATQAKQPPAGIQLFDWSDDFHDFADTAALIANLDLVISSDTAVVHLAGAMGKPVWVMLAFVPDWRWLLDREDSPWYPTMRLFRQVRRGDWQEVVRRVGDALTNLVQTTC